MSFLISLDTCIAFVRAAPLVTARVIQHQGSLQTSAVTMMGVALWLLRPGVPLRHHQGYIAITQQMTVVAIDEPVAFRAARLGANLRHGRPRLSPIDLLVAATALEHGLSLVSHNLQHFSRVPSLSVIDWMVP
jgi:tRNA(fMet)-specific endonuclease VapC